MNHKNTILTAVVLAAGALAASVTGCELLAVVDRTQVSGTGGAGTSSGTGGATSSTTTTATTTSTGTGGGTGGTGGTGTGGMMCAGGAKMCGTPQDCPDPMTECITRTCDAMGCCGTANVAGGTATMAGQTGGDCMQQVCDGNGATMMVVDPNDVPDDSNPCTTDTCDAAGNAVHTPVAGACMLGANAAVCGDPAGAAKGTCVACNVNADCTSAATPLCDATTNPAVPVCVAGSCMDGIKDGTESDKDCGGSCAGCANTKICGVNGDCASGFCNALVCAACTVDANCTNGDFCKAGVCTVKDTPGQACGGNNECASGVCSTNCCTAACTVGGACGATSCDATGACVYPGAGTVCRAAAGTCDVAESCNGAGACPADALLAAGTVCRAVTGPCDVAETCSGASAACPADAFQPASTVCRPAQGPCDAVENCTGAAVTCPADLFLPATTMCRASAGVCDVAENCDGAMAQCPVDTFKPATTVCRAVTGPCDLAENCTGAAAACPADIVQPATQVCRPAQGFCDIAESCNGVAKTCPADVVVAQGGTDNFCNGTKACDGAGGLNGDCKLANGQVCVLDTDCASGTCNNGTMHCQ